MQNTKKLLLIVNPVSGKGILRSKLWEILNFYSAEGYSSEVRFTQKRDDARLFAEQCPKEIENVICAGGDGTLNETICGLMANPHPHPLGYIPVGTTNDLAKSLDLSKNVVQAAKDALCGIPIKIDIGDFSGRSFNYIASFGAFTDASYNASQSAKNALGHFAYILEGIKSLANIRGYRAKFIFDDNTVEGDFIFVSISNTTSMGGVLKLKDTLVALNDGVFELILVRKPKNIAQLNKIVGEILSQKFSGELVSLYHTAEVVVETEEKIDWTLDGECHHGGERETIRDRAAAVTLRVPKITSRLVQNGTEEGLSSAEPNAKKEKIN